MDKTLKGWYVPQGWHRVWHKEWDAMWIHKSKRDLVEARGYSRDNMARFKQMVDAWEVEVIQVYWKKFYIDVKKFDEEME